MARYVDADCKRCRREKMKLFLKGSKCESPKCPFEKRPYPPGQHGRGRTKESEYLLQLREKQKATRMYGVLEKQFSNYFKEAQRQAALAPDREKLTSFANTIRELELPALSTDAAREVASLLKVKVAALASWIDREASVL